MLARLVPHGVYKLLIHHQALALILLLLWIRMTTRTLATKTAAIRLCILVWGMLSGMAQPGILQLFLQAQLAFTLRLL